MSAGALVFAETDRIAAVDIETAAAPPQEIEQERRVAVFDLLDENRFRLRGAAGPYRLTVSRIETPTPAYAFAVWPEGATEPRRLLVSDPALLDASNEYLALCAVYRDAVRRAPPSQIELADTERRAAHDEASELLRRALAEAVETDATTARRLFTLCCALDAGLGRLL